MGGGREFAISLDGVRDKNVMQLKKLNTVLFPVRYNDKYYADALASGDFTKLGLLLISCLFLSGFSLFRLKTRCLVLFVYSMLFSSFSAIHSFAF
ncbi:hypothetical protein Godav_021940 [Gossypium davidsonii]|uniref:N-acetyltransferase domain-containing protein n=1 Tax=Gossypium davidsonii TaxID=34287 RepID=A0A7J8THG7_GOSDV|nr:hypothetical protein [Gossypium davidsonii]